MSENLDFEREPGFEGEPTEKIPYGCLLKGDILEVHYDRYGREDPERYKLFAEQPDSSKTDQPLVLTKDGWDILCAYRWLPACKFIPSTYLTNQAKEIVAQETKKRINEGRFDPDLAVGIMALYEHSVDNRREEMPKSGEGSSSGAPIIRREFLYKILSGYPYLVLGKSNLESSDSEKGAIRIATAKMSQRQKYREIQIFDQGGNLTPSAFEILRMMPGRFGGFFASTLSNPALSKGQFVTKYAYMRFCAVRKEEHARMQEAILELAKAKPERQSAAKIAESIIKNHEAISSLGRETRPARETRPIGDPFLSKLDQQTENSTQVAVSAEELAGFLARLELPQNAKIEGLNISFTSGRSCNMAGRIDIPIPFVGGKIDFSLAVTQKENQSGIRVSNVSMQTTSNFLRGQLPKVIDQFSEIDQLLLGQVNARLKRNQVGAMELRDQAFIMHLTTIK